jgi:hypothetical protein
MKLHPRVRQVEAARLDLANAVIVWQQAHPDLTYGELFSILGDVLGGRIASAAQYLIREERHGDAETPGDFAADDDTPAGA